MGPGLTSGPTTALVTGWAAGRSGETYHEGVGGSGAPAPAGDPRGGVAQLEERRLCKP